MNIKFIICPNILINEPPAFSSKLDFKERTLQQLNVQLNILESLVESAALTAGDDVMPVVLCGEDFFRSGEMSTSSEVSAQIGECLDRDITYKFIATELVELSKKYPKALIIPGSMYVNVHALSEDTSKYKQNTSNIMRANLYVQSIAPVYYGGVLLRIIKKGDFLFNKMSRRKIISSEQHYEAIDAEHTFSVPKYREDTLEEINRGLVFLGKTPLPGEEALIDSLGIDNVNLFSPSFKVNKLVFGLEICSDHNDKVLNDSKDLDFHLITSNGVAWRYNACGSNGYRVQSDAESTWLCNVSTTIDDCIPLEPVTISKSTYFISPVLTPLRFYPIMTTNSDTPKFGASVSQHHMH